MSDAVESMEETVSGATEAASKRHVNWGATVGITLGILAIVAPISYAAFSSRLTSYEEAQEKRLIAYEGVMDAVVGNLESLRQENLKQIDAFSEKFDVMNGRIDGVHDAILHNIGAPYRRRGAEEGSLDAAQQP